MKFREEQNAFWRQALRNEFVRRCENNPAYSLRAFSNFLDVDQSLLSKVLNGQRNVSPKLIDVVSEKLDLSPFKKGKAAAPNLKGYTFVEDKSFSVLDHWSYFAILELFKTKNFSPTADHISTRLNIHKQEAQNALEILTDLGFLKCEKKEYSLSRSNNSWLNKNGLCAKKQKLQKKLTEKALLALDQVDIKERDNSSLTVAVDSSKIKLIKNKITELRRELDAYIGSLSTEQDCDEVYQTVISFFPLTTKVKNQTQKKNRTEGGIS